MSVTIPQQYLYPKKMRLTNFGDLGVKLITWNFVVTRVGDVPAPAQRLSHALGGPAAPSRNMSVVAPVTAPLAKSSGHGLGGNKSPSPQGTKGKAAMGIDNNDLGHLSYSLALDDIDDDLPHSTI